MGLSSGLGTPSAPSHSPAQLLPLLRALSIHEWFQNSAQPLLFPPPPPALPAPATAICSQPTPLKGDRAQPSHPSPQRFFKCNIIMQEQRVLLLRTLPAWHGKLLRHKSERLRVLRKAWSSLASWVLVHNKFIKRVSNRGRRWG